MTVSEWRKKQAKIYSTKMNKKKYPKQSSTLNRMGKRIAKRKPKKK